MRTYHNSEKVKSRSQTLAYAVVIVCSLIILTVTVILGVTLSRDIDAPVDAPVIDTPDSGNDTPTVTPPSDDTPPVVTPPVEDEFNQPVVSAPVYCLPVENGTVIREASLEMLVYMPSVNMWRTHNGVDFSATENAAVLSIASGVVSEVTETTLEGTVITVSHDDGLVSVYKSLSSATVAVGDKLSAGQQIGVAGTMMTESSDGVHLHLELLKNGDLIDPLSVLDAQINK